MPRACKTTANIHSNEHRQKADSFGRSLVYGHHQSAHECEAEKASKGELAFSSSLCRMESPKGPRHLQHQQYMWNESGTQGVPSLSSHEEASQEQIQWHQQRIQTLLIAVTPPICPVIFLTCPAKNSRASLRFWNLSSRPDLHQ